MQKIYNYNNYIELYENNKIELFNEGLISDLFDLTKDSVKLLILKLKIQYNKLSIEGKKKLLMGFVSLIIANGSISLFNKIIQNKELKNNTELVSELKNTVQEQTSFKLGYNFKLSQNGIKFLKKHEGFSEVAYKLKDGRITVGWGHAEPVKTSKYKVGQKISKEEAIELFEMDSKEAANGVRRIFKQWEEAGISIMINQEIFDALVSITYNAGIGSVRKSDFIQDIKKGNLKEASEKIKSFKINPNYVDGLTNRREEEIKMFLSNLK